MKYTYYVESEAQITIMTTITSDAPLDAGHIKDLVSTDVLSISGDLEMELTD